MPGREHGGPGEFDLGENRAGRIVIDKTGLTGNYNFTVPIPYTQLPEQLKQMADDSGVPSMFEGLKQVGCNWFREGAD